MAGKNYILPAVGAAVVVAGGAAAYLYFNKPAGQALNPQGFAKVVPNTAYMAAFISTDPQSWAKLNQFGTPEARQFVDQGLKEFQQKMTTDTQVDYEKDLKPWVGNVMVAMLPTATGKAAKDPNMLMVVGIKDKMSALNFANKMKEQSKGKTQEIDYKGIKITDFAGNKGKTYTAVVNDYLVMSPERSMVEQAIDTAQGQPSLSSKPGAEALLGQDLDVKNPVARFYLLDYSTALQQFAQNSAQANALSPSTLEQLKQVKSMVAGVGIEDNGIRVKAETKLDEKFANIKFEPTPGKVVSRFPEATFAVVAGSSLDRYWSQVLEQSKSSPETQQVIDQMRQTFRMVNLDLDKEVFGWMNGEFGLGMISSNQGVLSQLGFGGALVLQTSDRKTAESTLSKLDTLARSNVAVGEREVKGIKVTEWSIPGAGTVLGHGWLDNDSVFLAVGPLVDVMAAKPNPALDSSATFKAVNGSLPKTNVGYFYLDMEKTMVVANQLIDMSRSQPIPPQTLAVLNSIRGVGATSAQVDKTTGQLDMLMALKAAK